MSETFNSLLTPVSGIYTRTTCWLHLGIKFTYQDTQHKKCKKVLNSKELKFATQYLAKLKNFCLINSI